MKQRNYKAKNQSVRHQLNTAHFIAGVHEYVNKKPFKEFSSKNEQFLYERGRQFAAYLTHLGYDDNIIKNNTDWLDKELIMAVKTKALI